MPVDELQGQWDYSQVLLGGVNETGKYRLVGLDQSGNYAETVWTFETYWAEEHYAEQRQTDSAPDPDPAPPDRDDSTTDQAAEESAADGDSDDWVKVKAAEALVENFESYPTEMQGQALLSALGVDHDDRDPGPTRHID